MANLNIFNSNLIFGYVTSFIALTSGHNAIEKKAGKSKFLSLIYISCGASAASADGAHVSPAIKGCAESMAQR